ncbi:MAG: hypothetical protein JWR51_19 [Devosia sp.]|uniref:DUF262 domain-containing protein n=1 Tax=Devosia sp. TaxID=1871048 RepID=UPI002626C8D3|nr:DUF262 domain-containing protein [Devosia sp.]MDB5526916.1 hypothetical protein [Devosia sp.]
MSEIAATTTSDDQVASSDEYDIALAEGIEDEALLDEVDTKKFSITSYGADYTVDSLVKRMKGGAFTIPEFQRRYIWSQKHASKFIESLLMGLPVPGIFLYKETATNKHLVIDGQQRLRTLQAFYSGLFSEKKFRLLGIREPWANRTYEELDPSDQLKLDDSIVHATIFTQDEPSDVLDSIYFVFERINSGGIRLSPQEIRNCISAGDFTKIVHSLNRNESWRKVFGPENKRAKDEELIVRFFGMLLDKDIYSRPMDKFLNTFSDKMNKAPAERLAKLEAVFRQTVDLINKSLNGRAFRPVRSLNAAVFDAVMVGVATRLQKPNEAEPSPEAVAKAYDELIQQPEFRRAWERATADEENVKARMSAAINAFNGI